MSGPRVTGTLELDLSRHVDRGGSVFDDARMAVHRALSRCPDGVAVRVRLGRAQWVSDHVLDLLAELTFATSTVEIVGTDDIGIAYVVARLRQRQHE